MYIEGATHSSYQRKTFGAAVTRVPDAVATGTVLFLQAHVNGDADARKALDSDRLVDTIPGKVRYEWK